MICDFSKEKFDIVISAGQSNCWGCGIGPVQTPFVPDPDIMYLSDDFIRNEFIISAAQERVIGNETVGDFSLTFASGYIADGRLEEGRKLLIIRAAVGGTGFADHRWGMQDDLFLRMMEMTKAALALNKENRLIAFLWHQGETDVYEGSSREVHFNNLLTLVNAVRSEFNVPNIPFITADFVWNWKLTVLDTAEPVIDAIKEVCRHIGNARFIETKELQSNNQKLGNDDVIHFCRDSLYQLGSKFYDAYWDIIKCEF